MADFRSIFVGWREQAFISKVSIDPIISEIKGKLMQYNSVSFPLRLTDNGFSFAIEYDYISDDEEFALEKKDQEDEDDEQDNDDDNGWYDDGSDDDEIDVYYVSYRDVDFENQLRSTIFSGNQVFDYFRGYYRNIVSIDEDTKFQKLLLEFSKKYGGPFYQKIMDEDENILGTEPDFDVILHDFEFQFLSLLKSQ